MLRRLLQPVWVLLAVIFLIEAWLWDHLEPIVAWGVAKVPLRAFKHWLADRVDTLSPAMTLVVLVAPVIPLFPLKLVGFWLLAHEYWMSAVVTILFAKFLGVGVAAFVFDVTRPKLLEMEWFETLYEFVLDLRARASALIAPINWRDAGHTGHAPPYCSAFIKVVGNSFVPTLNQGNNTIVCFQSLNPNKGPVYPLPAGTPTAS